MAEVYTKSPLTFEQQLQQLKDRGLVIDNDDFALSREEGSDLPNYLLLIGLYPIFACYFSLTLPFCYQTRGCKIK